jgi:hypothetical protein
MTPARREYGNESPAADPPEAMQAGPPVVTPAAAGTIGTVTYAGGSLQIVRKVTVPVTAAGQISVPHGLSFTPTNAWPGFSNDIAGPAAGPVVNLDVLTVPTGMDGTNVYFFVTGTGTFTFYVA